MAVSMIVSQGSGSGNNDIDYNLLKCTFVQLLNLNTYSMTCLGAVGGGSVRVLVVL